MQLTLNINTNTGPDTSICQILWQNAEPLECHTAGGCYHGRVTPRVKNATDKAQSQTPARSRGGKPIPVAGVMPQQGIPRLTPSGKSGRGRSQPSTRTHAKRRHGARKWTNKYKTPSKRKDGPTVGVQNAADNNTQLHNIDHVPERRPEEKDKILREDNNDRYPLDDGYWDGLDEHIRLNTKKKETGGSEVVKITFARH